MKRSSKLPLLLLAALVVAASYLGGALAPPLLSAAPPGPSGAALVPAQVPLNAYGALQSAIQLLLSGDDLDNVYLPLIRR